MYITHDYQIINCFSYDFYKLKNFNQFTTAVSTVFSRITKRISIFFLNWLTHWSLLLAKTGHCGGKPVEKILPPSLHVIQCSNTKCTVILSKYINVTSFLEIKRERICIFTNISFRDKYVEYWTTTKKCNFFILLPWAWVERNGRLLLKIFWFKKTCNISNRKLCELTLNRIFSFIVCKKPPLRIRIQRHFICDHLFWH